MVTSPTQIKRGTGEPRDLNEAWRPHASPIMLSRQEKENLIRAKTVLAGM